MSNALLPRSVARFNKVVTNRVQGVWAPYLPPWAVIVHRGRVTGAEYRTPVTAFRRGGTLAVPMPYGEESDWVRNLLAEGRGGLERAGRVSRLVRPRVVDATGAADLPPTARAAARFMPILVAEIEGG